MAVNLQPTSTKMTLKTSDLNGNPMETTINGVNPELTKSDSYEGWKKIDAANRQLIGFSTNTYIDTEVINSYALNEVLEGEE